MTQAKLGFISVRMEHRFPVLIEEGGFTINVKDLFIFISCV